MKKKESIRGIRKRSAAVGTPGAGALTVIFAVLCLTVFAILALSTVLADARLSDRLFEDTTEYYEADAEAERTLAALRRGETPAGTEREGTLVRFYCPMTDTRGIAVQAEIEDGVCRNVEKQIVYIGEWNGTHTLDVWQGIEGEENG